MNSQANDYIDKVAKILGYSIGGQVSAAKTMVFAYITIKISKRFSPIIGYIGLVGLELAFSKALQTWKNNTINAVIDSN